LAALVKCLTFLLYRAGKGILVLPGVSLPFEVSIEIGLLSDMATLDGRILAGKVGPVPEFFVLPGRLKRYLFAKRYLFKSQRAQQGFQLFFHRDVGKPFLYSFRSNYKKLAHWYVLIVNMY
jgi:hypothetical protein